MWEWSSWAVTWRGVGTIGVGDILAFIQYLRSFTMPITQTANIANVLQSTAAAAERVFEFLEEPEEVHGIGAAGQTGEQCGAM